MCIGGAVTNIPFNTFIAQMTGEQLTGQCTMGLSIEIGERNIFESKWLDFSHFSTKDEFFHLFRCKTANILPEK